MTLSRSLPILTIAALFISLLLIASSAGQPAAAQNQVVDAATCSLALDSIWTAATTACINKPFGYICNGGGAPSAEPAGAVSNALAPVGALVEVGAVDWLRTPPLTPENSSGGIAWLRAGAPLEYTALLVGDVLLRDVSPPDFPAWTSMVVETATEPPSCPAAPQNALVLQSRLGQPVRTVVNGVSLFLNGTVLVRTNGVNTVFVGLSGQSQVLTFGQEQPVWTGQQLNVPHDPGGFISPSGPPTSPIPLDSGLLMRLPVALFDRPLILPQPGYVSTQGPVNLRVEPNTDSGIIRQVPGGVVMSVLGRSTDGLWYHVRIDSGESGWMLAELLAQNVGPISAVYEATPMPPQRYGELGTRARVQAPAGVNLRLGPDVTFPALTFLNDGTLVNLLARSPYSPWLKVESSGMVGWLALITVETQAFIDALPIDFNAPPPPTPTLIPGSFGNAFPDPTLNEGN